MTVPRYLVLRGGAIGDFVLTLPVLQSLRRHAPGSYIEVVGYPHIAGLALAGGLADKVASIDRREFATIFSARPVYDVAFVEYLLGFDAVLCFLYDPDGLAVGNLKKAGAKQVIYGPPVVTARHAVEHFLAPLCELGVTPDEDLHPELTFAEDMRAAARARLAIHGANVVVLHPGSGSAKKNWPVEKFVELAGRLARELKMQPLFSLGEADDRIARHLTSATVPFPVLRDLRLPELGATLSVSRGYVGNDAGITHLAAACGTPVVAIFGPSDPALWAPRGRRAHMVRAQHATVESLADLSVDDVFTACHAAFGS